MTVKIINKVTRNVVIINNVRDIKRYEKPHSNDIILVLTDVNHGSNTHVNMNEYELLSVE